MDMTTTETADARDPTDVIVGQRIRARRKELRLSQETLASAIGVSYQQLQKYETANNRVSASMLVRIAAQLECNPADLLPQPCEFADGTEFDKAAVAITARNHGPEVLTALATMSAKTYAMAADVILALERTKVS